MPERQDRTERSVQDTEGLIDQWHENQEYQPLEEAHTENPGPPQETRHISIDRYHVDLVIDVRNGFERLAREEPQATGSASVDALDGNLERAFRRRDCADDVSIGLERIRQAALGFVAELVQPSGKTIVQHDKELVRKLDGALSFQCCVEVERGRLV